MIAQSKGHVLEKVLDPIIPSSSRHDSSLVLARSLVGSLIDPLVDTLAISP